VSPCEVHGSSVVNTSVRCNELDDDDDCNILLRVVVVVVVVVLVLVVVLLPVVVVLAVVSVEVCIWLGDDISLSNDIHTYIHKSFIKKMTECNNLTMKKWTKCNQNNTH